MKIAWLNDFTEKEFTGGCQITNSIMISEGRKKGYTITEITPKIAEDKGIEGYDLYILNNINYFKSEIIWDLIHKKKYVTYSHDYLFCEYRNAVCESCPKNPCKPNSIFVKLYSNSLLNIFLSPIHLKIHKQFFGNTMDDAIFIPSPLEKCGFYPNLNIQEDKYLYAGTLMTHKGLLEILDFADSQPDKEFHFAGKSIHKEVVERIKKSHTYLGEIPHEQMHELYRKYKHFVINPKWHEPFGRTIPEALSSGCNLVKFSGSKLTGFESYEKGMKTMIMMCEDAPNRFWKKIEKVMNNVKN